jgi:hypothetical protein
MIATRVGCRVHEEAKWFTFRIMIEIILGVDDSWVSPQAFPAVSAEFETWVAGLFR